MPSRITLNRRGMLCSCLGLMLAGCGCGIPEVHPISTQERALRELGQAYLNFATKKKRGPQSLKELNIKGQQYPMAVEMIKEGNLIVHWGAPVSPDGSVADAILAYIKTVPEKGGKVLMQDGKTIRAMTIEEFKTTQKVQSR